MKFLAVFVALAIVGVQGQQGPCRNGELFVPHEDCTLYYICDNGFPVEQACQENLYWNPEITACDFPINVPECVGGTREPGWTPAPQTSPIPTSPEATTADPTTEATTQSSAPPSSPPPTTTAPTTTPPTTTVPTTTVPTTTPAPTTTPEVPETEATAGTTSKPGPGQCPPTGILKIAHEELCNAYYLCVHGERIEPYSTCPEGLYFNPAIEECDLAQNVDCDGPETEPTDIPTTSDPETTTQTPIFPNCPENGVEFQPYNGNCTLYYVCVDGDHIIYMCPFGNLFDTEKRQCVSETTAVCSVFFTDIDNLGEFELDEEDEEEEYNDVPSSNSALGKMFNNLFRF